MDVAVALFVTFWNLVTFFVRDREAVVRLILHLLAAGVNLAFGLYLANVLVAPAGNALLPFLFAGISGLAAFYQVFCAIMSSMEILQLNSHEGRHQAWLNSLDVDDEDDAPRRRALPTAVVQRQDPVARRIVTKLGIGKPKGSREVRP